MAGGSPNQPFCRKMLDAFLEYETPKVVHISNKTVGLINRILQLGIVAYIALYAVWYQRGYQEFDTVTSATTTKLKGIAMTNYTQLNISLHGGVDGVRIWDVADYVIPPQENDAFFVTTNIVITPGQTQGRCPEDPSVFGSKCATDDDCPQGVAVGIGNGVRTGRCVPSAVDKLTKTCEIYAWCPVEIDRLPVKGRALLEESKDFTVLIKNYIEFPKFGLKRRNILDAQNKSYLQNCRYNKNSQIDRLCPIFPISTILSEAGVDQYSDISVYGGVVVINIEWNCNLDFNVNRCLPEYSFSRLDQVTTQIAKGSNFRYAAMYEKDGTLYRDLFKAYGIRFILKVTGRAGKFDIVPLLLNIGSGVGLLAVASIVCDIIVLYLMKNRHVYKTKKYLYVDSDNENMPGHMDDDEDDCRPKAREKSTALRTAAPYAKMNIDNGLLDS